MSDHLQQALKRFALISMEREALRQRLALLDRQWMDLAQSEELQSLLRPADPPPETQPPGGEQTQGG
jgi:hypothetical protein